LEEKEEWRGLPAFLMGESMGCVRLLSKNSLYAVSERNGVLTPFSPIVLYLVCLPSRSLACSGAVAYSVYNRNPELYRGVVFVCPMCKISDDMLPPRWVIDLLSWVVGPSGSPSTWVGRLPIAPSKSDLYESAHHDRQKAEMIYRCPTSYGRNPRLVTARELLKATASISASLRSFAAPFLVLHGRDDRVTDPQLSLGLYRESPSEDKTLRLYDGMWHGITSTEPDRNLDRVFNDCIGWMLERSQPAAADASKPAGNGAAPAEAAAAAE
jgi:pimeloyl-ACP methyl ester carboxylesterase